MDIREIGKTRSQRIEIDYYRKPTGLSRARWILALVALAIAGTYGLIVLGSGGGPHLSTGSLAAAHAAIEMDCAQCHADFTPIAADAKRFAGPQSLQRNEQACRHCHQDVDPHFRSHLTAEFATIDQQCSGCHREHQGRDHDLVRVAQQACTQCHADLNQASASAAAVAVSANISAFTQPAHGDFASLQTGDAGRVHFDHALHMLPGQVAADSKGAMTLAMLEPAMRESYRKQIDGVQQSDQAAVTLSCGDCHVMAGVPGQPIASDDEIGRHMEPIAFERHCVACHAINPPGRSDETLPLPHAAPWSEIDLLLTAKISGGRQSGTIRKPRQSSRSTPLVGEGPGAAGSTDPAEGVEAVLAAARAAVQTQCLKCHLQDDITAEALQATHSPQHQPLIPPRWFRRGIYDHAAHRRIDCVYCHQAAYPPSAEQLASAEQPDQSGIADQPGPADEAKTQRPRDSETVMIGGIETCVDCHRSAGSATPAALVSAEIKQTLGGQSTWASDGCTLCHRYHGQRADDHGQRGDWAVLRDQVLAAEVLP